jgi:hypothetical protein
MLTLDLNRLLEHREIQNPRAFLVKSGFTYHKAGHLLKNQIGGLRHLELLCLALNCTPNELFSWTPDKDVRSPKKQALSKLMDHKRNGRLLPKIKELPEDKLEELHRFIDKLSGE